MFKIFTAETDAAETNRSSVNSCVCATDVFTDERMLSERISCSCLTKKYLNMLNKKLLKFLSR